MGQQHVVGLEVQVEESYAIMNVYVPSFCIMKKITSTKKINFIPQINH
jgi:hypothetical protein